MDPKNQTVAPNSKMRKSSPFVHNDGIMRAQGRLKFSALPFNQLHPIILSANH